MSRMSNKLLGDPIDVPLSKLTRDPNNIRFRHMGKLTQSEMDAYLLEEEDVRLLMNGIISAGKLHQPLLVIEDGDDLICKEGNRRLLALRMIQDQIKNKKLKGFTEDHFDMIPVRIIQGTEEEIDVLLGTIHVSGNKPWNAANRGYLIHKCIETHGNDPKQVADKFGMVTSKVMMAYKGFIATEKFGQKYETEGGRYVRRFFIFEELYRNCTTKTWVNESDENLDYFINVVGKSKMTNLKDVRKFAKFLKLEEPKKARVFEALNHDNMTEAWKLYEEESKPERAWNVVDSLYTQLIEFPHEFLKQAIGDKIKKRILTDLGSLVINLQDDLSDMENNSAGK